MKDLLSAVQKHREEILAAERYLWANPETGYREIKATAYLAEAFERLGYSLVYAEGITGFYTVLDTGRPGPEVLILGELDSIVCPAHPEADPKTGAVHSCGHNAQCAALLGIAAALKEEGALDKLCGKIRLCAVPAEELLEIEYRSELKRRGVIRYYGGKSEFLSRGYFDGVDIAFMVHTSGIFGTREGSVGCLAKNIIYKGLSSHAGGNPAGGRNALYAATMGINAINAIRETFREPDLIRVHPIITHGGDMVNAIPGEVRLESYVRGSSFDAIARENAKVNRALVGGALSLGTNIEIVDIPGYAPLRNDPGMIELTVEAAANALPHRKFDFTKNMGTGSTDMGDLSTIMPVIHPYAGGAKGTAHGSDYQIADPEQACVESAMLQLAMLHLLLSDGAARAKRILADFKPQFDGKEAYLAFIDSLASHGDRIEYRDDGTATVRID